MLKHQDEDTRAQAARNRKSVLETCRKNGGWLVRAIVEWTIYFGTSNAASRRACANRLLTTMVKEKLLQRRALPGSAHELAWVLTRTGARQLEKADPYGTAVTTGTSWGNTEKGAPWSPPKSWTHDARGACFLVWASAHLHCAPSTTIAASPGWTPLFENTLQQLNDWRGRKRPDGVLLHAGRHPKALWIEVEASRKVGKILDKQIAAMADVTAGHVDPILVPSREWPFSAPMTIGRTTMIVLPPHDAGDKFKEACMQWLQRQKRPHRILYQLASDLGSGEFEMGPVVNLYGDGSGNATQRA